MFTCENNMLSSIIGYLLVGILWGCTNPFIKHAQNLVDQENKLKEDHHSSVITNDLYRLITKPILFIPYLINQSGSLVYYYLLSHEPITKANPLCNSLTFIFTAITGYFYFKEEVKSPFLLFLGILLVLIGVYISLLE